MKLKLVSFIVMIGIVIASCSSNASKNAKNAKTDSSIAKLAANDTSAIKDGQLPIFYNMYLSVEMSSLFKSIGASYNFKLLNSPDKVEKYNSSTDKAMNLGVYAVDLTYSKYFEQF